MTTHRTFGVCLAILLGSAPALGQQKRAGCSEGRHNAMSEIGCELSQSLGKVPEDALVVSAALGGDAPVTKPEALTGRLAAVIAGTLGLRSSDQPANLGSARSLASTAGTLVFLQPALEQGELRVVADVYPVPRKFWDRVRDPEPSPTRHAFAARALDPELRSFLPPVPLVARNVVKARSPERDIVALGCGDVNGDGASEIVAVGRRRIHFGRVRQQALRPLASVSWSTLSPIAPFPLREPLGAVQIQPGRLVVGLSDRARVVALDRELALIAQAPRRIPWPGGGCVRFAGVALAGKLETCFEGDAEPTLAGFDERTDAVAGAWLVEADGKPTLVRAGRLANLGTVLLEDSRGRTARVENAGAQLGVGDLDGDGQPELLSGADTRDPAADALIVHTWQHDGRVVERQRIAAPGGVQALAVCPPEDTGLLPVVMATGSELWVVR